MHEGFSTLGEPVQKALISQLGLGGVDIATEAIDVEFLDAKLSQLFGSGSRALMRVIYDRFSQKIDARDQIVFPDQTLPVERILTIIAPYRKP